jgi:acetyl-CoA carboxylase/biotin carboxylase 1
MISGMNLPAAQLQIAMGIPLHYLRDIRKLYGLSPGSSSAIDFTFIADRALRLHRLPRPRGHVIAARLTAENPDAGFRPSAGTVHELNFRSSLNCWGYFAVGAAGGLHEFADSQFGHIFAFGENRETARRNIIMALKELSIRSDFKTTIHYLIKLFETPVFTENLLTTSWLDGLIEREQFSADRPDPIVSVLCGFCVHAARYFDGQKREYVNGLAQGRIPSKDLIRTSLRADLTCNRLKYSALLRLIGPGMYEIQINSSSVCISCRPLNDGGYLILIVGVLYTVYAKEEIEGTRLTVNNRTCLLEKESDPSLLRSPSSGKLVKLLLADGEHVAQGQPFAEIEVMKMCMTLVSAESGVLHHRLPIGALLKAGDVICELLLDDDGATRAAQEPLRQFNEPIPSSYLQCTSNDKKPDIAFMESLQHIQWALDGFAGVESSLSNLVGRFLTVINDPQLPRCLIQQRLSGIFDRLPADVERKLNQIFDTSSADTGPFPVSQCVELLLQAEQPEAILGPLVDLVQAFRDGPVDFERQEIVKLLEHFYSVEQLFDMVGGLRVKGDSNTAENVIRLLR